MIEVSVQIKASAEKIWDCFTQADHIQHWNFASADWHCPKAANELVPGGHFSYTMAAKDGSFSFDLEGTFDRISAPYELDYHLADGRKVFFKADETGMVTHTFEPEMENSEELQKQGWQSILNEFGRYVQNLKD
jgi:uncharacterized protein YndB with AHSA1/START domain